MFGTRVKGGLRGNKLNCEIICKCHQNPCEHIKKILVTFSHKLRINIMTLEPPLGNLFGVNIIHIGQVFSICNWNEKKGTQKEDVLGTLGI